MKYDHEAAKKVKAAVMNTKKTTQKSKKKKKTSGVSESQDWTQVSGTPWANHLTAGPQHLHLSNGHCYLEHSG